MGRGRPIDSSSWPAQGPKRRFAELLDKVHRDNGVKSLRTVAAAMNLRSPSRVSALLRLKALPADESQVRMLIKALGGSDEDIERGLRLYRVIMSTPQDTDRSSRVQIHGATIAVDPAIVTAVAAGASSPASVRRTLPRDIQEFTGRDEEFRVLLNAIEEGTETGQPVLICAIGGMAGVGKTTLAMHAAHRLASRFPDGQLFVRLHAHARGQQPVEPGDALAALLRSTGMDPRQIPAEVEERAQLWRDRLAGKRILLVLDDAATHEQVEPLMPGTGGSAVVVTSRRRLTALRGMLPLELDIMPPGQAADLFTRVSGRGGSEPGAVAELVELAGRLPLAIQMLGARLRSRRSWTVADLAGELAAARDRSAAIGAADEARPRRLRPVVQDPLRPPAAVLPPSRSATWPQHRCLRRRRPHRFRPRPGARRTRRPVHDSPDRGTCPRPLPLPRPARRLRPRPCRHRPARRPGQGHRPAAGLLQVHRASRRPPPGQACD